MDNMIRTDEAPNPNADSFGERLHKIRRRRGIDGRTLASALGVTQASVSQWERDKARPSLERIEKLADVLDADLLWLAFGKTTKRDVTDEGDTGGSTRSTTSDYSAEPFAGWDWAMAA